MKNKPDLNKKDEKIFDKAVEIMRRNPVLSKQSSAMRRAWCEGFVNGHHYYNFLKPKAKWYEFWK